MGERAPLGAGLDPLGFGSVALRGGHRRSMVLAAGGSSFPIRCDEGLVVSGWPGLRAVGVFGLLFRFWDICCGVRFGPSSCGCVRIRWWRPGGVCSPSGEALRWLGRC